MPEGEEEKDMDHGRRHAPGRIAAQKGAFSATAAVPLGPLDARRASFAYHATCEDALDGIRAHGLLPNDGTRGFWPDGYDVFGKLFLCTTQDGADYADAIRSNMGPEAMLRFPLPVERTHDPRTDSGDGWWIGRAVPAHEIEMLSDGAWSPITGGR